MARLRKVHLNRTILFVTTAIEQGLLLRPNPLINEIIWSCLARAQALFPVIPCHFLIEATHGHFILVVDDPQDIKGFMERFKTESAHAINRLLGRKKRTVWCEGYDSPVVLTLEDALREIVYTYTNPAKDSLEDSISKYPGVSSWKMFTSGNHTRECPWIHRSEVPCIKNFVPSLKGYLALARKVVRKSEEQHTFQLQPDAWMECFGVVEPEEQKELNAKIKRMIKEREAEYREERERKGHKVVGREKLVRERMNTTHMPKRSGRRMWCICSDIRLRASFILAVRSIVELAEKVWQRWRRGDFSISFPLGLYAPSMPRLAEPLPSAVFD